MLDGAGTVGTDDAHIIWRRPDEVFAERLQAMIAYYLRPSIFRSPPKKAEKRKLKRL